MGKSEATFNLVLTDAGKVVLTGIGFVAVTALVFPAFGVLSILVWVVLTSLFVGFVLRPRIQVSGRLPDRIVAGQSAPVTYTLRNIGRFAAYNLCVELGSSDEAGSETIELIGNEQVISRLAPGETIEVAITIRPRRRGYYQINQPTCRSSFPFNLFSFGTSHNERENLIVLPAFHALQMTPRGSCRQVHAGSARPAGRMGYSTEYAGNRPFLPGDSPRQIDARAWARLAAPATREYHDDFDYYAALVLDTEVPVTARRTQSSQIDELEAAVSLCASIAFTINKDRVIELLVAGPGLHRFTDSPRTVRLDRIHEILAGVEPAKGDPAAQDEPLEGEQSWTHQFRNVSEIIFVLMNWNLTHRRMLEAAHEAGCHTTVLLVGDLGRLHLNPTDLNWLEDVQFLSAKEILSGRVERI
ncbi:MAG: DUF58 domain-containing protein [Sedimentisphaerales bacterium]|jgi:uncharacterized protein (DUF58 family)